MKRKKQRIKRKLKVGRLLLAVSIVLAICLGIYYVIVRIDDSRGLPKGEKIADEKKEKEEEKEKTYKLSMIMVGDNLIHNSVYNDANRNADYNGYDFTPMYELIKPIVSQYDLAYYNQETILGGTDIGLSSYPCFNSPYEVGDAMIDAGFNLVSLATNHTIDRGEKAVINSNNYWKNHDNVYFAGSYASIEERNEVKIAKKNNISYAMLNYTYGTNGIPVPSGKDYLVNVWPTSSYEAYSAYKSVVEEDINKVRDKVDVLIVAMHWGTEYTHTPTDYEVETAEYLASLGVDIIIGTHPHVIQPVTWIDDTLVFYSLGNLLSAQETDGYYMKMVGLMSSLDITKTVKGKETTIKIDNISNELTYNYYKNWKDYKIIPFSQITSEYLYNYEEVYNNYKEIVQKYDENMSVVPLS